MASKPDRPKIGRMRRWIVEFDDGETIEIPALHRAEARHYSVSFSIADGMGGIRHYRRVKSVKRIKEQEIPF